MKGYAWTRGGTYAALVCPLTLSLTPAVGAPYFSKSTKQGLVDVDIIQLEVNYSKNGLKCTLKFEVEEHGGGHCSFGPSHRSGGFGRAFMW